MFADKLKERRKEMHWPREKLGKAVGVSTTLVYKWETGQCEPSIDKLKALCDVLDLSMDELLCDDKPEKEVDEPVLLMTRAIGRMSQQERDELLSLSQRLYGHAFEEPGAPKPRRKRQEPKA